MSTEFQRARSGEHKRQRVDAILGAARRLALRDGVRTVTLTEIAAEVGMHKSALLRYFETREEIFLRLTAEEWTGWAAAVEEGLRAGEPAAVLCSTLAERPLFCELLSHAALVLERNVSLEAVRVFKLPTVDSAERVAAALEGAGVPAGRGIDVVAGVTGIAASLWQTAHPPERLAELYLLEPRLAHSALDFRPRLERLTAAMIAGLRGQS